MLLLSETDLMIEEDRLKGEGHVVSHMGGTTKTPSAIRDVWKRIVTYGRGRKIKKRIKEKGNFMHWGW